MIYFDLIIIILIVIVMIYLGVAHGDELPYVFYMRSINKNPPPEVGSRDRIAIERMTRLITNFIIFG